MRRLLVICSVAILACGTAAEAAQATEAEPHDSQRTAGPRLPGGGPLTAPGPCECTPAPLKSAGGGAVIGTIANCICGALNCVAALATNPNNVSVSTPISLQCVK